MFCRKKSKKTQMGIVERDQGVRTYSTWEAQYTLKRELFDERRNEHPTNDEYGLVKGEKTHNK